MKDTYSSAEINTSQRVNRGAVDPSSLSIPKMIIHDFVVIACKITSRTTTQPPTIVCSTSSQLYTRRFVETVYGLNYISSSGGGKDSDNERCLVPRSTKSQRVNLGTIIPSSLSTPETILHDFAVIVYYSSSESRQV